MTTPTAAGTVGRDPGGPRRLTRSCRQRPARGYGAGSRYRLEELIRRVTADCHLACLRPGALPLGAGASALPRRPGRGRTAGRGPQGVGGHRLAVPSGARRGAQRDPELGSYIVCEYATGQSLEMILSHGPLSGLEAAWVVRRGRGRAGRRAQPGPLPRADQSRHRDHHPDGNVKIVGLLIEAALRPARVDPAVHGADTPELVDVPDLGRLLYACLSVPLARRSCVQPAGCAGCRPSLGDPAPGPGRCLSCTGQRLRPDPR